jgi:hypothetical protein
MYHRFLLTAWLAPIESNINEYQTRRQYETNFAIGFGTWVLDMSTYSLITLLFKSLQKVHMRKFNNNVINKKDIS